jgi:hypothetical protein
MQHSAQQRIVNLDVSIVVDKSKFAKLVHKKADPGSVVPIAGAFDG